MVKARATADGRVEVQVGAAAAVLEIGTAARLLAELAAALGEAVRVATAGLASDPVILLDGIREAAAMSGRAVPSGHRERQTQVALATALLHAVGADLGEPAHWAQVRTEPLTAPVEPRTPVTTHRVDERNLPPPGGRRVGALQPPLLVALDPPVAGPHRARRVTSCDHCAGSERDADGALVHAHAGCPGALPRVEPRRARRAV